MKIVHEELTELMGTGDSKLAFGQTADRDPARRPAGLGQDDRRRRSSRCYLRKDGTAPCLVAADLQRPAAIDQLEQLGRQIQIPVYRGEGNDPVEVVRDGVAAARPRAPTSSSSTPPAACTSTRR